MEKIIAFLAILAIAVGCKSQPEPFDYTIRGTVVGLDSGQIYMSLSRRVGDRVTINYRNNEFEYKGTTPNMFNASIMFKPDYSEGSYSIVVEPGEVNLELHVDSIRQKSKVISGSYNLAFQKADQEFNALYTTYDFRSTDFKDKIIDWVKSNSKNYSTVSRLYMREDSQDYFPLDLIGEVLNGIEDNDVKKSREYVKLYSNWRSKKDSINMVGKEWISNCLMLIKKQ